MGQLIIKVTPTSSSVLVVQPGGSATYTYTIQWSQAPSSDGKPITLQPVSVSFGVISVPPGVSVTFSPAALSMGVFGGQASCRVQFNAAADAADLGPTDSGFWMSFNDGPQNGVPIELTVGKGSLIQFSSVFNGSLTISHANFSVGPQNIPAGQATLSEKLTFAFTQQFNQEGPIDKFSVSVSGVSSLTFPVTFHGNSDVITASVSGLGGTYTPATGFMDLTAGFSVNDTSGVVSPEGQSLFFDVSTNNSLTAQNAGIGATGSAVNSQGLGSMTLVGGPQPLGLAYSVAGVTLTGSASLGLVLTGTFSNPPPGPPAPPTLTLPNFVGRSMTTVTSMLSSLGLGAIVTNKDTLIAKDLNTVLAQIPAAGTVVQIGSTVNLTVGVASPSGGNGGNR